MHIQIKDKLFPKEDLLKLMAKSKLQAIKYIRKTTKIGLKDAKEIVDNLSDDPNIYNHKPALLGQTNSSSIQKTPRDKKGKVGSHVLKGGNPNLKWIYLLGFILFIAMIYYLNSK